MLIATQSKSVVSTQQYFNEVLTQGDYYLGQEVNGHWRGRGADLLGLGNGSVVEKEDFAALLKGRCSKFGMKLSQRDRSDRRPGMDLTFSVPKSVSLAWAINDDERIIDALRASVHETMTRDVEPLMHRRVRQGKHVRTQDRKQTGKLIYADFLHKTSRPVDGRPDPHLHVHAFVVNWTEDQGKHYAAELGEIVRQRPSLQAKFEARLANRLKHELGYDVERSRYQQSGKTKHGWEIAGIDRTTIEKFSRRTGQVEAEAKKHHVTDASEKGKLGVKTREGKDKTSSVEQLRSEWRSRLTEAERHDFGKLGNRQEDRETGSIEQIARKSLEFSIDHHLYRQSTSEKHTIVGTALEHAVTLTPEQIEKTLGQMDVIEKSREGDGTKRDHITTREVLDAEKQMIDFARDGRGTRRSISRDQHEFERDWLDDQQKSAVNHVLQSRDTVTAIAGGAGTGKSSLMEEAAEALRGNGKEVFVFAPSTGAREVLQEKGFDQAQTVEHLLRNEQLQSELRDEVMWIDEAGLLDVRSMNGLFKIAEQQNARVMLSGDTRQHASPRRGEAMRLLEKEAGLDIARVEAIQRQKGGYREAIELISRGHDVVDHESGKTGLVAGFDMLDRMGKIKEVAEEERHERLASEYQEADAKGKSSIVVAPTHAEAKSVTEEIRKLRREEGTLGEEEQTITRLQSLNLSEAEKSEPSTYLDCDGAIIQFHQNAKGGFRRGEKYELIGTDETGIKLRPAGSKDEDQRDIETPKRLPLDASERFEVYRPEELSLAVGDKVRFSLGGTAADGKGRISNGRLDELEGFDRNGDLLLKSGMTVRRDYGHVDLGYVVTSHASQGKDRHIAMAAMGSQSLPAINAKQFYVTASRGREDVAIYVDDKSKVRQAIQRSGEQLSATELVHRSERQSQPDNAHSMERYYHQASRSVGNARDRLMDWWHGQSEDRTSDPARRDDHQQERGREIGGPSIGLGGSS
tara:strand:+ start:3627 stop:6542 length:2916 start_codon:yes stop_codon:yes gene_type:complete